MTRSFHEYAKQPIIYRKVSNVSKHSYFNIITNDCEISFAAENSITLGNSSSENIERDRKRCFRNMGYMYNSFSILGAYCKFVCSKYLLQSYFCWLFAELNLFLFFICENSNEPREEINEIN